MKNDNNEIRYTMLNGIFVPELSSIVSYIGQQSHPNEFVKTVTSDTNKLTFTKVKDNAETTLNFTVDLSTCVLLTGGQDISGQKRFLNRIVAWSGIGGSSYGLYLTNSADSNLGTSINLYTADHATHPNEVRIATEDGDQNNNVLTAYLNGTLEWVRNNTTLFSSSPDETVVATSIKSSVVTAMKRNVDTSYLQLVGGSDTSGSRVALYGKSHSDYAGWVALVADNATNENKLYMKPNGTFLCNDYITVKPKDNGTSTEGTTRDAIYSTNGTAGSSSWLSNVFFTAAESPDGVATHRYSVLITRHSSSNGVIYAFPFSVDDKIYQCRRSGGTWQSWKSISFA